jgi:replication factor A1
MVMVNYEKILEKIAGVAGVEKDEIERRVEAKRAKLSGLISKEGAAQVIAAELGINFDNEKLKIDELLSGMRKVNTVGKVITLFPVREFNKNGKEGKVANMVIADDTANIKVVLWDTNHIELIEKGDVKEGSSIEVFNGGMRDNEIHLGSFSEFKKSDVVFENVNTEVSSKEKTIATFANMDNVKVRAFIMQVFDPRFFNVCPECKRKANQEGEGFICSGEHGKVNPEKRSLINIVIDDGTETIRSVLFHENISTLGLSDLENVESMTKQKQALLGKEMFFSGNVRKNKLFNNMEFIIDRAEDIDVDALIKELEN